MTQAPTKKLYERDLKLWIEDTIAQLKSGNFHGLDVENLIEELEGLAGRDKCELRSRLATLLEHILKRCYVKSQYDYAGWESAIARTRFEIEGILKQSPSLRNYVSSDELFDEVYAFALREVRRDRDYATVSFPDKWQVSRDVDSLLSEAFWGNEP